MSTEGLTGSGGLPSGWSADPYLRERHASSEVQVAWATPTALVVVLDTPGSGREVVGLGAPEEVAAILGSVARGRATTTAGERGGLEVLRSADWAITVRNAFELLDDDEATTLGFSANTSARDVVVSDETGAVWTYALLVRRRL